MKLLIVEDEHLLSDSIVSYLGKEVNPKAQKGNGLGLAIVKAICDYHQWKVEYSFEENRHRFVVRFKDVQDI